MESNRHITNYFEKRKYEEIEFRKKVEKEATIKKSKLDDFYSNWKPLLKELGFTIGRNKRNSEIYLILKSNCWFEISFWRSSFSLELVEREFPDQKETYTCDVHSSICNFKFRESEFTEILFENPIFFSSLTEKIQENIKNFCNTKLDKHDNII